MRRIRAVIGDDEPPARRKLKLFLKDRQDIDVVGEAGAGPAALELIRAKEPDLVLLDIQMPGMDGFEVLSALETERMPHIVFVTVYDQHAVRAFDVGALDYVLKPFDRERFDTALARALERARNVQSAPSDQSIERVLEALSAGQQYLKRFMVRDGSRLLFVRVAEVDWLEAAGNYVRVHTPSKTHLVRGTLKLLSERLDPAMFARIHRTTIVNLDRVSRLEPWSHGDYRVHLVSGKELTLSRRYRRELPSTFGESGCPADTVAGCSIGEPYQRVTP
jgi:two-component system LytT family response regulator